MPSSPPSVDFDSRFGFVPDPPASDQDARFGFVPDDAKPSPDSRFGFVEESPAELHQRIWSFNETPTDYEIGRLIDSEAERKRKQSLLDRGAEFVNQAIAGGGALLDVVKKGVSRPFETNVGVRDVAQSVAEGFTQGTARLGKQLVNALNPEAEFVEDENGKRRRITDAERRDLAITKFRQDWEEKKQEAAKKPGDSYILPEVIGKADPQIVEAASILDPTLLLGGAAGAEAKGASLVRRGMAAAAEKAGGTLESAADKVMAGVKAVRGIPTRIAEGVAAPGTEEAAQLAAAIDRYGNWATVGGAGLLGVTSPGTLGTLASAAVALPLAKVGGQALSAVSRNLVGGTYSEQLGLLGNIARDAKASGFVRGAARLGRFADPALSLAGRTVEGALHGGAAAGLITASLGGSEDEVAQSVGGGGLVGGATRALAGALPSTRRAAIEADLARWKSSLTPETVAALEKALPAVNEQARVMNAQNFISGLGDVDFEYLTGKEWKAEGLPPANAMETSPGPRPRVRVNVDQLGNGAPVFHEIGHVLRRLFPDQIGDLDGILFSDFVPRAGKGTDFTTGRTDTSEAILSPKQQQALYDSYFSKLDRKTQSDRRAAWSTEEHMRSAREEIVSELLSNLLQDRKPDFLMNLSGPRRALAERLIASQEQGLLSKIPGLRRDPTGSSLLAVAGQNLETSPEMAAGLRKLLKVRDRTTARKTADEAQGAPVGVVTRADMLGPQHRAIARVYGNSDIYAKNLDGSLKLMPDGRPVLLDEGAIRKLQAARGAVVAEALTRSGPGAAPIVLGDPVKGQILNPVQLLPNGESWRGHYFTDAQMAALADLVRRRGDLLTPQQLADIARINEGIKSGKGSRLGIDYNAATKEAGGKGKRVYNAGGASKFYETVPVGFGINKKGGFYVDTFDVGNIDAKLARWMENPKTKGRFDIWNQDPRAVVADIKTYLTNQRAGLENSLNLEPGNATRSIQKRNLISDLIGGTSVEPPAHLPNRALPDPLSTKAGRDNSVKSIRIDRINRLSESGGEPFPVDYFKVKENLMPLIAPDPATGPLPPGVTPGAVIKHVEAQAVNDLKTKLVAGGAPPALADDIAATAWKKAEKVARRQPAPHERAYTVRAAEKLDQFGPADLQAIRTATIKGGTDGAAKEIEKRLLVSPNRGQRIPVRVK